MKLGETRELQLVRRSDDSYLIVVDNKIVGIVYGTGDPLVKMDPPFNLPDSYKEIQDENASKIC